MVFLQDIVHGILIDISFIRCCTVYFEKYLSISCNVHFIEPGNDRDIYVDLLVSD
jgi:hypothetical protein